MCVLPSLEKKNTRKKYAETTYKMGKKDKSNYMTHLEIFMSPKAIPSDTTS